jgi:hypothetical protein
MKTSVLGIRLNDEQRERLRAIGADNRMGEVEVARLLIEKAIDGTIKIEKGHIVERDR